MAPFNTHFLIAEKIWPEIKTETTWPESDDKTLYGQFCFGCVAPDVDKVSPVLTQRDTHFFDRTGDWNLMASHRSAALVQYQAEFFGRPFSQLCPPAQAFALGYLCHLCVDEVSKYMWRRETWLEFKELGPGPAFAALDEFARQQIKDYDAIREGICSSDPLAVIPRIPPEDLMVTWQGVCNFVRAESTEEEYLALVDLFDRPTPELRQLKRVDFLAKIDLARQRVDIFKLDTLLEASLARSRQRLGELIRGEMPEPGDPQLFG